jgi:predicted molibdopterin-dependent oxidoreductase YjgC
MGALPDFLPGYQSVDDAQARKKFGELWGVDLPAECGLTAVEMIGQARGGKIKGMYIVGENPALSFPHTTLTREALASLEFLTVEDMFVTETAKLATVVLPAAGFAEKEGTFTNFEGRLQRVRKAIKPLGDSLPDWEIILRLADRMGCPMPYSSLQQVRDEIAELIPFYQDIGSADSEAKELFRARLDDSPLASRRIYGGQFPKGFGRFSPVQYIPGAEFSEDEYPFTLLSGSTLCHSGSGVRSSRASRLKRFQPDAFVEINESDAERLGISPGDEVKVVSPLGEITARTRITDTLAQGMLFMPVSFSESPVNALFDIVLDPQSKNPSLKACAVRLERSEPGG